MVNPDRMSPGTTGTQRRTENTEQKRIQDPEQENIEQRINGPNVGKKVTRGVR